MAGDTSIDMMVNVLPGTLTGIFALNAGLSSINQQFQNMTKAVDNHFGIVDAAIVSASALALQLGKSAADAFGEYEQGMKIVQAVSGQSASAIAELGQRANEFSVQYRMDISELTDGLQTLGRAGLKSATEQSEVLENGLQTAKLEGRALNSVLEELLQNTTLLGGDLKSSNFGEQTQYVNDLLVATSMTAPINTHDVSETLKYSGGIAAAAGANIETDEGKDLLEDYMASIAAFAQKGVKGSIAGTALRAFFNKPATQDSSVVEGLNMIGLKPEYLWEDDQQTMKPISEQINLIQSQMDKKNISQMDRLQIWSKIVGGKMGQQMMKLDGGDIRDITKDIKEANSAEKLATQSMQSYQSALKQTGEAGQMAFRSFGEHIARFLRPVAQILTPILEAMANPVISTAAFTGFITLMGQAFNSIKKIFGALRLELGMIKNLFNSITLNQNTRKGMVANRPWGQGGFLKEKEEVNQISTQIKESSSVANVASSEILAKIEHFRTIVTATNNKIKEVLIDIQAQLSTGITTHASKINQEIVASGVKMKTEFSNASTQSTQTFGAKMNQTISSSAAKMKTEFTAAMAALTFTPNFNKTMLTGPIGANAMFRDVNSPFSGTYSYLAAELKSIENDFKKEMTAFADKNNPMLLRNTMFSSVSKEERAVRKLEKRRDKYGEQANALKLQRYKFNKEHGLSPGDKGYVIKGHKEMFFETQYALLEEEIQIRKRFIEKLKAKMAFLETELNAMRLTGAPLASPVGGPETSYMPGVFPGYGGIPSEYRPNFSTLTPVDLRYMGYGYTSAGAMPAPASHFSAFNVPPQYLPNTSISGAEYTPWNFGRGYSRYNLPQLRQRDITRILESQFGSGAYPAAAMMAAQNPVRTGGSFYQGEAVSTRLASSAVQINSMTNKVNQALIEFDLAVRRTTRNIDSKTVIQNRSTQPNIFAAGNLEDAEKKYQEEVKKNHGMAPTRYTTGAVRFDEHGNAINIRDEARANLRDVQSGRNAGGYVPMSLMGDKPYQSTTPVLTAANKDQVLGKIEMDSETKAQMRALGVAGGTAGIKDRMTYATWDKYFRKTDFGKSATKAFGTKGLKNISSGFKGLGGALGKVTAFMGNPFFAGMIAADIAMQAWTALQQAYSKKLEEAVNKLDEAVQTQEDAVNTFYQGKHEKGEREFTGWDEEHPDATGEEREDALLTAYSDIYDNRSKGLTSLDENTQQLAIATEEVRRATDTVGKTYLNENDFFSGTGSLSDIFHGQAVTNQQVLEQNSFAINSLSAKDSEDGMLYIDKTGKGFSSYLPTSDNYFKTGEVVLDEGWQKGEDYPWLKEFAPIIAADIWREGSTEIGLRMALGGVGYAALNDQMSSIGGWDNSAWVRHGYNVANYFKSEADQNNLQMGLKNYGKEFSKLAKQTRRFEKSTGSTALGAFNRQFGKTKDVKKALSNLAVQDPKLVSYIKSLALDTGMSEQQVLMAAQLQQLQDMQQIAENQVTPQLMSLVGTSYDQVAYGANTLSTVQGSGEGAISAAQNAAAIAALLQVKVETELGKKAFQEYTDNLDPRKGEGKYKTPEALMSAAKHAHDDAVKGKLNPEDEYLLQYYDNYMESYAQVNSRLFNPQGSPEAVEKAGKAFLEESEKNKATSGNMLDTLRKGLNTGAANQILAAYDASLNQEESSGSGGGSGSGKGSDKNDNQGTKKERVDLVLCNKKEIPKLNVNLFKKPPSFTVLNKNFKLRDVKINTQDKPKAIMASIKNAFIDVQKRSDPKIIQDEEAEYDPVGATEGNAVPSGEAKTKTNR